MQSHKWRDRGASSTWAELRGLVTPSRLAAGLTLGCTAWLAEAGSMMILASPMGVHLSLAKAIIGLLVLNVGIAVPVSPGNVGAYEAADGRRALFFWVRDRLAKWLRLRARRLVMAVRALLPAFSAVCKIGGTTLGG